MRTQSLKVLPLKPGVGQFIAMHATLTARDIFLANFYPSSLFICIFFQNLSRVRRSGELWTRKFQSHLMRTQSLKVLSLKPRVGQYIAMHTTLTARDFFLAYFYTSRSIYLHFVQNLSRLFPVLAVANTWFLCRPAE